MLQPLHALIEAHVLGAERLHGDDTLMPILAKGKTIKGHIGAISATTGPSAAGGAVLCLPRPAARTSRAASQGLQRHSAGGWGHVPQAALPIHDDHDVGDVVGKEPQSRLAFPQRPFQSNPESELAAQQRRYSDDDCPEQRRHKRVRDEIGSLVS